MKAITTKYDEEKHFISQIDITIKTETGTEKFTHGRWQDGKKFVYLEKLNGELHADNKPARIIWNPDNLSVVVEEWYKNGLEHRIGGPALIFNHEVSPAIGLSYSRQEWIENGQRHNFFGPAIVDKTLNKDGEYFIYNTRVIKEDFLKFVSDNSIDLINPTEKDLTILKLKYSS